ncbi:BglG family transcription antiterminator [Lacrimispora indolis]|uniref:BglG family transcription antiterminator n=1 Tax=Lacrimispora indolis TaxID=69825 RepID=UPI00041F3328|nr:PRD domain-containing protein [[Clostridium] methoxybenzovorans]
MQSKQIELINYMMENKARVLTSQQLADVLNISMRSVKTYISQINETGKGKAIISNKNGYTLNVPVAKSLLAQENIVIPQTYEERSTYVIKAFFLQHTNSLDLYHMADELYVSDSTLKADIKKMNMRFKSFNIVFAIERDQIKLQGPEKNIRKLFSYILYEEVDNHYVDLQILKSNFKNIDIDSMLPAIKQIFSKNDYYINDLALRNMLLHLVIIIERIQEGKTIPSMVREIQDQDSENECVAELCKKLEQQFSITINEEERREIYVLFKSSTNFVVTGGMQEVRALVGNEIMEETKELVYLIQQAYAVNLDTENFIIPFALHLKNLMLRAKNSTNIKNPMLESIQSQHLILFDMALYVSLQLEKKHKIYISQDEVAFIALHIGGEIERQKNNNPKVRVVLLCPSYMNIESRLYNELLINFSNDINIVASVRDSHQLEELNYDLLISTVRIKVPAACETAVISPFMTSGDKLEIQEKIENSLNNKKNKMLTRHFNDYFEKELFFVSNRPLDKMEVIDILVGNLYEKEYVRRDYREHVLMRERAACTAFGKIAIPHSVEMNAYKTCASVMISGKGIRWENQIVYVVLMITINKLDNHVFKELYESLVIIFSEETNIELFRECRSYEEFESTLKSIIG